MKIEYLADHPAHVPTVAAWQQAQFGYLTLEDRTERLKWSLWKDALRWRSLRYPALARF